MSKLPCRVAIASGCLILIFQSMSFGQSQTNIQVSAPTLAPGSVITPSSTVNVVSSAYFVPEGSSINNVFTHVLVTNNVSGANILTSGPTISPLTNQPSQFNVTAQTPPGNTGDSVSIVVIVQSPHFSGNSSTVNVQYGPQ